MVVVHNRNYLYYVIIKNVNEMQATYIMFKVCLMVKFAWHQWQYGYVAMQLYRN